MSKGKFHFVPLSISGIYYSHDRDEVIDIMWPASQSHFHLLFIFIEMNCYV